MRRPLWLSIAPVLLGVLAIPQADARGGGGGGGGGFHAGFSGSHGGFHGGARIGVGAPIRSGFVHNPRVGFDHNPRVGFPARERLPVAHRSPNQFPNQFGQTGFPWWGGGWGGWPVGWSDGGYYGYANPPAQPAQPQVIVIRADDQERMMTAEAAQTPDFSYVQGCHAIANGYHCDTSH